MDVAVVYFRVDHNHGEEHMRRHELSDEEYALIAPLLLTNSGKTGHPWGAHRPILNGIFWRLATGAAWRDIPERYGPWQTIYDRYVWWRRTGLWDQIVDALQLKLDEHGLIDWDQWSVDGSIGRAHRAAAGAPTKKGQTATRNRQITR